MQVAYGSAASWHKDKSQDVCETEPVMWVMLVFRWNGVVQTLNLQ